MASQAVLDLIANLKDNASAGISSIGGALSSLGTVGLGIAAAGITAVGVALVSGIGDAREANALLAQTEQIITSTGGAAGVTAKQVTDLATELSAASGHSLVGDDQVQAAENVIIKYKELKGIIPDVTRLSVDMAARLGGEPAAAAETLSRALAQPEAAAGRLAKMGIVLSDAQEKQIKTMVAAGDVAGAQALIMEQLNTTFGGAAQAAADADGGWAQFRDRMGEAAETAGAAVLPLLTMLAQFLNDPLMPAIEMVAAAFAAWLGDPATQAGIQALGDTISTVLGAAFAFLANEAIPALVAGWQTIEPAIATVTSFISDNLQPILYGLAAIFLTVVVPAFIAWSIAAGAAAVATVAALAPVLIPLAAIGAAVALLKAAWDSDFGGIRTTLTAFWEQTGQPIFTTLVGWLGTTIPAAVSTVSGFFSNTLWPALQKVWAFLDANVIPIVGALANVWFALLKKEVELLAALWSNVLWPALEKVGTFISGTVVPALQTLAQDAMNGAKVASDALGSVINTVLGPAFQWLNSNVISPVVAGFGHINSAVQDVIGFLNRLASSINAIEIPSWLQGHSPPPLADWFDFIGTSIGHVADEALPGFGTALGQAGDTIGSVASSIGGAFTDALGTVGDIFGRSDVPRNAKGFGEDVLSNIGQGIEGGTAKAVAAGQDAKDLIGAAVGQLPDKMPDVGKATVDGIQQGVDDNFGRFRDWMGNKIGDELVDWVKQKLGIASPSAVFADIANSVIGGMVQGLGAGLPEISATMSGILDQMESQLDGLRENLKTASGDVRDAIQAQISDLQKGINEMTAAAAKLPDLIAAATEGVFSVTASIDRQQEQNLARLGKIADDNSLANRSMVEAELAAAEAAAKLIPDPAEAAEFFKLRSKQIFELADLERGQMAADAAARKKVEDDHAAEAGRLATERTRLEEQLTAAKTDEERAAIQEKIDANKQAQADEMQHYQDVQAATEAQILADDRLYQQRSILIYRAQQAEQEALKVHQANALSVFEQMRAGVQALIGAIPGGIQIPPNWASTILAYQHILEQLNHLYSLPAPAAFVPPPPPIGTGGDGIPQRPQHIANTGAGGGTIIMQSGAVAVTVVQATPAEARRLADLTIREIDRRRGGRG
jgi:hypothetical protein